MAKASSPMRAAYVVKVGKKFWTRDRSRLKTKGKRRARLKTKGKRRAPRKFPLKDFYGAGIISTLGLAQRIANGFKGAKVMPVNITLA